VKGSRGVQPYQMRIWDARMVVVTDEDRKPLENAAGRGSRK
jgi:hypothetical protein